jgi:antitoxin FitA
MAAMQPAYVARPDGEVGATFASIAINVGNAVKGEVTTLTVRNLDPAVKARLRVRAAQNGRSMEAEARAILRSTLEAGDGPGERLGSRIHARFARLDGDELELPPRDDLPRAADLGA